MNRNRVWIAAAGMVLGIGAAQAQGQVLSATGPCPGTKTFTVTGATPVVRLAFIHAQNTGSWVIPFGQQCAGTTTGLANPIVFAGYVPTNNAGTGSVSTFVPAAFCNNRYLQAIDTATCTPSNVLLIN